MRTVIQYGTIRRVIVVDPKAKQELKPIIKDIFNIQGEFNIIIKALQAQIFFSEEIDENDEILIIPIDNDQLEAGNLDIQEIPHENKNAPKIDMKEILGEKIIHKDLLLTVNSWANPQKFKVCYSEGMKQLAKRVKKRTIRCTKESCPFKLIFLATQNQEQDPEELIFQLESFQSDHNHELDYEAKNIFSLEIINEINMFKGKFNTLEDIREHINKKFLTNFDYNQIVYQVNK